MANGNDIDKAKKKALETIQSKIDDMGTAAYGIWLKAIEEIFNFKNGKIIADKNFVKQLNKLTVEVLDLIQKDPKFTGTVSSFIKRMTPISEAITEFQKETNGIKVPDFEVQKNIVIDEIMDKMLGNGLNQHFIQPLRDLIYQNASGGGLSLTEARALVKDYIIGGKDVSGKLGQYVEQTSKQAVSSYSGIINKKLFDTFNYNGMKIVGALIDTSSPQCIYAVKELGREIKESDWPELKKIAEKNGLVEGTEFSDLPINLLHWGCNHDFFPIIIKKSA